MRLCPSCGGLVDDGSSRCPSCGKEVGAMGAQAMPGQSSQQWSGPRTCVACGRTIQFDAFVCPYCGHDYRIPMGASLQGRRTWKPAVGGVLVIIAGLLAVAMAVLVVSLEESDFEELEVQIPEGYTVGDIVDMMKVCGVMLVVFAGLAIIGGIFGLLRKSFKLAIVGGVFGMLGIGFVLGSILGLVGLILIAVSREEFK